MYQNEKTIGDTLTAMYAEGIVQREQMFLTTKLWNTFHRADLVREGLLRSLAALNTDYIDLYLIHWPTAFDEQTSTLIPRGNNDNEVIGSKSARLEDTWLAMIRLVDEGLCRGVGVCNFNLTQLNRVLAVSAYIPLVMQFECHPYLVQRELCNFCKLNNITVIAYAPLGSPNRPNLFTGEPNLFSDAKIIEIAQRLGRNQAQVLIRFQIQRGHCTIPKSVKKRHILGNRKVFDFELNADDMKALDELNYDRRFVPMLL